MIATYLRLNQVDQNISTFLEPMFAFYTPWFSSVFVGYKLGTLARNGLANYSWWALYLGLSILKCHDQVNAKFRKWIIENLKFSRELWYSVDLYQIWGHIVTKFYQRSF